MKSVLETILTLLKKLFYLVLEYFFVILAFTMKFVKLRMKKWDACRARKRLDQACSALGKDIYSLYTQGLNNWQEDAAVKDKLKAVEEAESNVLVNEQDIQNINNEYFRQKEEIKERYGEKRAAVGRSYPEDEEPL